MNIFPPCERQGASHRLVAAAKPAASGLSSTMRQTVPLVFCIVQFFISAQGLAQLKSDVPQWPTVGTTTEMADVILPGPKLTGKPINDVDPVKKVAPIRL